MNTKILLVVLGLVSLDIMINTFSFMWGVFGLLSIAYAINKK